jgi:predicted transcriptional regulator
VLVFDKATLSVVCEAQVPAVSLYHFINGHQDPRDPDVIEVTLARCVCIRSYVHMYVPTYARVHVGACLCIDACVRPAVSLYHVIKGCQDPRDPDVIEVVLARYVGREAWHIHIRMNT